MKQQQINALSECGTEMEFGKLYLKFKSCV
jgi:hypothetical protein